MYTPRAARVLYRTVVFLLRWCCEVLDIGVGWQGVCRLHGICIDSLPNLYLVTEPVLGGTLEACLQQFQSKGVPLDRAFALARSDEPLRMRCAPLPVFCFDPHEVQKPG